MREKTWQRATKWISLCLTILTLFTLLAVPAFAAGQNRIVAFDPDDGVTGYEDFFKVELPVGSKVTGKPVDPARDSYLFAGWYHSLDADNNPVFWNFEEDVIKDNTTLWAAWTEACIVAFDPDDGVTEYGDFHKVTLPIGSKVTGKPVDPTRDGYLFAGWYHSLDANDNPVFWNFEEDVVQENTTLWAAWTEACIVAFDPDDGVTGYGDFFKVTLPVGSKVTGKPADPTRDGYLFTGWYYALDANDNPVFWNFEKDTVKHNTTLWAAWAEACTVTFDPNDGVTQPKDFHKITLPVGSKITGQPANPTREGYDFKGWYVDGSQSPWNFDSDTVKGNTTLKAAWEKKTTPPEEKKPDSKDKPEGLPKTGGYDLYILSGLLLTLSATVMTVTTVSRKRRQKVR